MTRGFNSEADPRRVPKGMFPEFTQLTAKSGVITPRPSDTFFTPSAGAETFYMEKSGDYEIVDVYNALDENDYLVSVSKSGGELLYGTDQKTILLSPPSSAPVMDRPIGLRGIIPAIADFDPTKNEFGIKVGETGRYAAAWRGAMGAHFGFSPVVEIENTGYRFIKTNAKNYASEGTVITNTTRGGATAIIRDIFYTDSIYGFVIHNDDRTGATDWQSGDTVTYGVSTCNLSADESTGCITPQFTTYESIPSGAYLEIYRLEDSTGIYRDIKDFSYTLTAEIDSNPFPYNYDGLKLLKSWSGPLDNDYLPETLLSDIPNAQAIESHKGCLFVASESTIRYSEAEQPPYFRKWTKLSAFGEVMKMISRDEILEVYTPTAVKYIVGNPPYFEIRETGITEGPVSRDSIVKADPGTFALFDDGIYLVTSRGRKNLTRGTNGGWINAMSDPANSIGGASHGIYYLVDADGSCLAYDWEADEWFTRSFSEKPVAFRYSDNARSLIAILPTDPLTYLAVGGGSGDTDWSLAFGEEGDGKLRKTPCEVRAEIEGELTMSLLVDGVEASSFTLDESGRYPLPLKRGRHYQIKLSGTAAPGELEIREMEPRG